MWDSFVLHVVRAWVRFRTRSDRPRSPRPKVVASRFSPTFLRTSRGVVMAYANVSKDGGEWCFPRGATHDVASAPRW